VNRVEVISDSDARVRTVLTRRSSSSSSPTSSLALPPKVSRDCAWRLTVQNHMCRRKDVCFSGIRWAGPFYVAIARSTACAAPRARPRSTVL
jgi:hypothetical protein